MKAASFVTTILILIITLLPACTCGGTGEATPEDNSSWAEELADRFSPVILLKNDEAPQENFEPAPVETLIDQTVIHTRDTPSFIEKATILIMGQYSGSSYYLDIPDISPAGLKKSIPQYIAGYEKAKAAGYKPTVYARVTKPGDSKHTVVQYWLFYYFDEWSNLHEGDWELVELVFPDYSSEELVKTGIPSEFAAYSQHQAGQRLSWAEMQSKGLISDTHPKVYVGRGSHANYFTPGQYWLITDFDDTGLSNWREIEYQLTMISGKDPGNKKNEWLDFQGLWGEYLDLTISWRALTWTQSGPNGPCWGSQGQKSQKWQQPYQWADKLAPYPQPYFMSFIPTLAEIWDKLGIFSIFSPADISVYDRYGHKAGLNESGEFLTEIPGAEYIAPEGSECKTIIIPDADVSQDYTLIIEGTGIGTMDIKSQVPDAATNVKSYLEYRDIPVTPTIKARLQFRATPLTRQLYNSESVRDNKIILEIDQNGDGKYESKVEPGTSDIVAVEKPPTMLTLTLLVEGAGVTTPTGKSTYEENSTVSVSARPEKGWVFDHWGGDYSGTSPSTRVVMDKDKTIIAYFKPEVKQFSLTIGVEGKGTTNPGPGTYFFTEGSQVSIQALPEPEYELAGWSGGYGNTPTLELTIKGDITITASFRPLVTGPAIDQINEPIWKGGWTNIAPENKVGQSIVTRSPVLEAVDVNIITANTGRGGDTITMKILYKGEQVIASISQSVQEGFNGWLRFEMPKGGIDVPAGTNLVIRLEDTGKSVFGWKYAGDTYPLGSRFFFGQAQDGDFFFRTYSTAGR
jgi:hypothetical protein